MNAFRFAAVAALLVLAACGPSQPPAQPAKALVEADPATMQLYNRSCISCHSSGAGGAPRTGDQQAWAPRMAKGMEVLLDNTINGFNGMPPMGMCMDCDAGQFESLIRYMAQQ